MPTSVITKIPPGQVYIGDVMEDLFEAYSIHIEETGDIVKYKPGNFILNQYDGEVYPIPEEEQDYRFLLQTSANEGPTKTYVCPITTKNEFIFIKNNCLEIQLEISGEMSVYHIWYTQRKDFENEY